MLPTCGLPPRFWPQAEDEDEDDDEEGAQQQEEDDEEEVQRRRQSVRERWAPWTSFAALQLQLHHRAGQRRVFVAELLLLLLRRRLQL
jgi:hypothetical protein